VAPSRLGYQRWGARAAWIGAVITVFCIAAIVSQGDMEWVPVTAVALIIAAGSAAAAVGARIANPEAARWWLRLSAVLFGVLAVLALFSIGILLAAASTFAMIASVRSHDAESNNEAYEATA
jgi:hypothetical protein